MVKISLNDPKFVVLVAALFSGALAFLILRQLLTTPGVIESIDIQWNQYISMFELWFHTWNFYSNGSQIIFVSQFPIYSWVLVFQDVALAQKFVYFSIVSLLSFNMFLVTFYTLKRTAQKTAPIYLGSIVASLIYTLNPFVFSEIFHISFLWAYSLFPLVFYFGWESFNNSSRRKVFVSALLLSIFFAFMADAWAMLVGLLILVIVAVSSAIMNGRKNFVHRFTPNFSLTLLIMGIVTLLLAAYWLLPYVTQRASEPVWDLFSVATLKSNSGDSLVRIFGLHSWSVQPFFSSTYNNFFGIIKDSPLFYGIWEGATLLLPIVAVLAVLLRRNKLTLTLFGLLVVGIFLAKGTQPPFGEFYTWLTFYSPRIIPVQAFLLKYPYLFLAIVSLSSALLSAILVSTVFGKIKFKGFPFKRFSEKSYVLPTVLFFSIISIIALVGSPLLTGNLNQALNPVELPLQYRELNNFFDSQEGTFRVMWVPQVTNFNWSNNPWANKIEYWGSGVPPLFYGWGIVASPNTGFLGDMIYDYLLDNQTQYLGKLLALGNVRYIVFHNDSKGDPASAYPAFDLYFRQYKSYLNWFIHSPNFTDYYLTNWTDSAKDPLTQFYSNFTAQQNYNENYKNSTVYQNLLNSSNPILREFNNDNETLYKNYFNNYTNSLIYQSLQNSEAYLKNFLKSQAYQGYLNNYQSSTASQNFIDSPIYNNTHDYLNSSEYLILTSTQYFQNSPEYKDFINSPEYRNFLYYYLIYSNQYTGFQKSSQYSKYQTYLNDNLNYKLMCSNMLSNLQSQKDLKLVTIPYTDDNENLFVYENTEMTNYFQAYSKANLVVGGLDTVGSLSSIRGFYLNDSTYLFVENQGMSESNLASFLNSKDIATNVLFYNNKTIDDLVLDTLDSSALIAPSDVFVDTSQDGWLKDVVTSYSWAPLTLGDYKGVNSSGKYDFGLGHNLLYTTKNENLTFSISMDKRGEYDVWARLLFSPTGGELRLSIDNRDVGVINTNTTKVFDTNIVTSTFTYPISMEKTESSTVTHPINMTDADPNEIINFYKTESIPELHTVTIGNDSFSQRTQNSYNYTTIVTNITTTKSTFNSTTTYANGTIEIVTNSEVDTSGSRFITTINGTINSILGGFKWVHLGNINLTDAGIHVVNIENENGALNAVNLVALPTVSELEKHRQNVLDLLTQSDARIVYVMDKAFLGSLKVGGSLSVPFNATKQSLYNINLESNQQLSELNVTVDNRVLKAARSSAFAEGENWYSIGPIDLCQGYHNITLSNGSSQAIEKIIIYSSESAISSTDSLQKILGGGAEPFVVSYEKTDPVFFAVVVNASKPFVLSFHESYDELWQSNISTTRLILNSVDNGFLVNITSQVPKNELVTINITYSPEAAFQLGTKVTVVSFVFVTAIISVVLAFPKFKKKLAS